jgi:hypothetical protein
MLKLLTLIITVSFLLPIISYAGDFHKVNPAYQGHQKPPVVIINPQVQRHHHYVRRHQRHHRSLLEKIILGRHSHR